MAASLFSGMIGGYSLAFILLMMGHPAHVAMLAVSLGGAVLTVAAAALNAQA